MRYLVVAAMVLCAGCGLMPHSMRQVRLPETPPGEIWRAGGIVWRIRWPEGELETTERQLQVPVGAGGVVVAVPYTLDGFRIGPAAGAVARWREPRATLQLCYREGWINEVGLGVLAAGGDLRHANLERVQQTAMQATGGLAWTLSVEDAVFGLLTGTLSSGFFRPPGYNLEPEALILLDGWRLPYPPHPQIPNRLPAGEYLLWHPAAGIGWLRLETGGFSWQQMPDI
ncbi:hypothetical protein [Spirochaeta africana]|uniref:Uncharacterized protein n=1 Tax=Spirochaeta africana (strain ATCC 700263 / DSM 8902 / Z-7692) TaxID=889378 RepID=H9UMC4_SPIAZ|nr:hypothetical protein [Spirochaeta africana]AFG38667.1 hypothetical protein Spiaf_2641 [Spirochaeta africana DSM 8902]